MKRIFIGAATVLLLLIAGSGAAHANDGIRVDAGLQMWINYWTHFDPRYGSIASDTTVLFGPEIEVQFRDHVFVDASYLFSLSDYTFLSDSIYNEDRQDASVAIGYMIIPQFGVLAGYKNSENKTKETGVKDTVYGPFVGMILMAPMAPNASFYAKLDYLFTRFKQTGGFQEENPGWIWEFGLKFDFTRTFSSTFGYKYETYEGNNTNIEDSFSGLIFKGMFMF